MHETSLTIDGHSLILGQIETVARKDVKVSLNPAARRTIQASADSLEALASQPAPVYGVNTGYGIFSDRRIDPDDASALSRNLILSHAVPVRCYSSGDADPCECPCPRPEWRPAGPDRCPTRDVVTGSRPDYPVSRIARIVG